jgi:hypothetical protein
MPFISMLRIRTDAANTAHPYHAVPYPHRPVENLYYTHRLSVNKTGPCVFHTKPGVMYRDIRKKG